MISPNNPEQKNDKIIQEKKLKKKPPIIASKAPIEAPETIIWESFKFYVKKASVLKL